MSVSQQLKSVQNCDAGDVVGLDAYVFDYSIGRAVLRTVGRRVAMVVTAPRGRAVLFAPDSSMGDYVDQSDAVKAFMAQHCNGR